MNSSQLLITTANFIMILTNVIVYSIIARILMSWLFVGKGAPKGRVYQFLYDATEPLISVARKVPHRMGMVDFAPLIAMFVIDMGGQLLVRILLNLA